MAIYIHSSIKEEVEEELIEIEEEATQQKIEEWEAELAVEYCPECGSMNYSWLGICEDCGFPHQQDSEKFTEEFFDNLPWDFQNDVYAFRWYDD